MGPTTGTLTCQRSGSRRASSASCGRGSLHWLHVPPRPRHRQGPPACLRWAPLGSHVLHSGVVRRQRQGSLRRGGCGRGARSSRWSPSATLAGPTMLSLSSAKLSVSENSSSALWALRAAELFVGRLMGLTLHRAGRGRLCGRQRFAAQPWWCAEASSGPSNRLLHDAIPGHRGQNGV